NFANSVNFTRQRAMIFRSKTQHVHGNEQGTGGGIKSGTTPGQCEPIEHAAQVRAEGSHVIRHQDKFWMNNRNTIGEARFVRDTKTYKEPEHTDPVPGSVQRAAAGGGGGGAVMSDADPAPYQLNGVYAQLAPPIAPFFRPMPLPPLRPLPLPPARPVPPVRPPAPAPTPRPPTGGPKPKPNEEPGPTPAPLPRPRPLPKPDDNVRIDDDCPTKLFCFKPHQNYKEWQDQLKMQQDGLNSMSPGQVLNNMATRTSPSSIAASEAAKAQARADFLRAGGNPADLFHPLTNPTGLHAIHRVDMIAGGNPSDVVGMGDGPVNSSIGSSWRSKQKELKAHAEDLQKRGCPLMKVWLADCDMIA
ncbi:MAG: polymorphic toxin type 15 domain-containing protein, partial [Beijerinckiaceae bacterium]